MTNQEMDGAAQAVIAPTQGTLPAVRDQHATFVRLLSHCQVRTLLVMAKPMVRSQPR